MISEKMNSKSEALCPENVNMGKNKSDILSLDELIQLQMYKVLRGLDFDPSSEYFRIKIDPEKYPIFFHWMN